MFREVTKEEVREALLKLKDQEGIYLGEGYDCDYHARTYAVMKEGNRWNFYEGLPYDGADDYMWGTEDIDEATEETYSYLIKNEVDGIDTF